jgi:hypothetical protein
MFPKAIRDGSSLTLLSAGAKMWQFTGATSGYVSSPALFTMRYIAPALPTCLPGWPTPLHIFWPFTHAPSAELIVCDDAGLPDFYTSHFHRHDRGLRVWAFDLLHHNGRDLRDLPCGLAATPFG